ncbi:MAG: adenine phosphoribosyltransferase [Burkholderiaceae bacterium]|jgi:adenine phosphoribosyltransferase|nr:adenine phosphoribosyltransferase [Burkholderiaceae bacterium]
MSIISYIRTIPDYPKKGVQFRDITTLLLDARGLKKFVDDFSSRYANAGIDKIAVIEARGFLVGAPLAYVLGCGLVPIRKKGKLPGKTIGQDYLLEYGSDRIEVHDDAILPGQKILLIDDLLATGGTALAAASLIEKSGGKIHEFAFLVDLPDLGGHQKLREKGYSVFTLCEFAGE